jgi:pimeloyl-ACP methyl ester carboxylesterase
MPYAEPFEVAVDGAVLAGKRWHAEAPTVAFLHSGVTDQRSWFAVSDRLGDAVDAVCYDRRGFGATPPDGTEFRHADDLAAVLSEVTSSPVVLVGNSMGGELALDFALTAPDRVAGMLLIAPAISGAPEAAGLDPATMVLGDRIDRAWEDGDKNLLTRLETWLWLDGPGSAEGRVSGAPRRLAEEMNRRILLHDAPEGAGKSGLDAWSRLGEIRVPTLVVAGELDVPHFLDRSRLLSEQLADGAYRTLPGTAHLPSLDVPDVVASLVSEVAARVF